MVFHQIHPNLRNLKAEEAEPKRYESFKTCWLILCLYLHYGSHGSLAVLRAIRWTILRRSAREHDAISPNTPLFNSPTLMRHNNNPNPHDALYVFA